MHIEAELFYVKEKEGMELKQRLYDKYGIYIYSDHNYNRTLILELMHPITALQSVISLARISDIDRKLSIISIKDNGIVIWHVSSTTGENYIYIPDNQIRSIHTIDSEQISLLYEEGIQHRINKMEAVNNKKVRS